MSCERPFDPGCTADPYKRSACEKFKALFSGTCVTSASVERCVTPSNHPKVGRTPSVSSVSCHKLTKNRGPTNLFDQTGFLTVDITDKIISALRGRKYLAENEIELIHVLLSTFCDSDLKSKQLLSAPELRLLGKLAVLAFRNVPDGEPISVPSFPRWNNISVAKLPAQYKLGDEEHNQLLFKRRIKTGKKWMGYLPGLFNDELISKLFLDIDPARAQRTIRKYQNNHLRLSAEDSLSLKEFVGMSDMSYTKFNRGMFYFSGSWFLAPIRHVQEIRTAFKKKITQVCPPMWWT